MQYHSNLYTGTSSLANRQQQGDILLNILFVFALPILSVIVQHHLTKVDITPALLGRWFILWVVGIRLLVVGFAKVIHSGRKGNAVLLNSDDGIGLSKITGLAKMALAGLGFLCVAYDQWSLLPTITVGIYLGLAGFQHDFKKPTTSEGWISMSYDMIVCTVITTCLVF